MKKNILSKIFNPISKTFMAAALLAGMSSCDNVIYDYDENCDEVPPAGDFVDPKPEPEPGFIRIYVRTNPGSGGTSCVTELSNEKNTAETTEGTYVSIDIDENSSFNLTATESNPDYIFIGWHDDTNDGDLTPGRMEITNIKTDVSTRYTAVFQKIDEIAEPEPGYVRIYVRTNPGSGGTSAVSEDKNKNNVSSTEEGLYVSIDIEENSPYTLTATESNPEYRFVRWHDDSNDGDLTPGEKEIKSIKGEASTRYTAIFEKIEEAEEPAPDYVRIYVRSNPGSAGTSAVNEVKDPTNNASTTEGLYVSIDVKKGEAYTLAASETNPGYRFVRWHDDTNDGNLTEGLLDIKNIRSDVSTKYTAVFERVEEIVEPDPDYIKIYVRSNPGSAGTSAVTEVANTRNTVSTDEGLYVSIEVKKNSPYNLSAAETNPEYRFIGWHDDTNDGSLTSGLKDIKNVKSEVSTRYTAMFEKIEQTTPDPTPDPDPQLEGYYVQYVFDRNMQYADAFSQRVNSVDLYVFNQSGTFLMKYHEEGAALKAKGYLMELTGLQPGTYEFIAWCGLANNSGHFTVPSEGQISRNDQVICTMPTSSDAAHSAYQNKNLNALFHGRLTNATYTAKTTNKQIQTVYLTKNTNNINITLQHKDGLEFNKDRFTVTMHDANDIMRHDNSMHSGVHSVQYRPYYTAIGTTANGNRKPARAASTTGNYLQVEISTARLMAGNNPIITVVDNETGKTIFSIPLVKWALQLRSSNYRNMDDQEYLDREDQYNMMLWLDSNKQDGWFGAEININNWHVIDDSTNF